MKKFLILGVVVILTLTMVAGCVREAEEVVKTYSFPGEAINTGVNEEFVIALDSIGSPYRWEANYDDTMLELVDSRFEVRVKELELVLGTWQFKFKALKVGETEITMVYSQRQPGQPQEQLDRKVFTVNIK